MHKRYHKKIPIYTHLISIKQTDKRHILTRMWNNDNADIVGGALVDFIVMDF